MSDSRFEEIRAELAANVEKYSGVKPEGASMNALLDDIARSMVESERLFEQTWGPLVREVGRCVSITADELAAEVLRATPDFPDPTHYIPIRVSAAEKAREIAMCGHCGIALAECKWHGVGTR